MTDTELIQRVATGDTAAFEDLYRRHVDHVVSYAVRRCRDAHEVSELCAAVFLAAWERASTFDAERGDVGGWLTGIAANRFVDLRRRDRRQQALRERLLERRVLEPNDIERLTERIDAARAADDVIGAVRSLPEAQRDVVSLVAVDGLTSAEAADRLGSTPTAVRMRLSRARRSVQELLGADVAGYHEESPEVLR
jgi:RNA polymerase sigma-70 factor (ECF subfamily)